MAQKLTLFPNDPNKEPEKQFDQIQTALLGINAWANRINNDIITLQEQGVVGDTGPAGATGPQGPTGPAGVISGTSPIVYNSGTQAVSIDSAVIPKAWVSFSGSATPTIYNSYNVSSVTQTATGRYRVAFTNNLPYTFYPITFGTSKQFGRVGTVDETVGYPYCLSTSGCSVAYMDAADGNVTADAQFFSLIIF